MNLRSLDLNLLVVLQALLDEGHVTRASRRLALSQPATSNALERCRHIFKDPLLEKVGSRMRLTAKGQSLRDPLARALSAVASVMEGPADDLTRLKQTVRLSIADRPAIEILMNLQGQLKTSAPLIDLVLLPWRSGSEALPFR